MRPHLTNDFDMQAFRHLVRRQALLMRLDEDAMVSAIPDCSTAAQRLRTSDR